jgi:hypothetical protein
LSERHHQLFHAIVFFMKKTYWGYSTEIFFQLKVDRSVGIRLSWVLGVVGVGALALMKMKSEKSRSIAQLKQNVLFPKNRNKRTRVLVNRQ